MARYEDLTGRVFDRLTVLRLHHTEQRYKSDGTLNGHLYFWECQCKCGSIIVVSAHSLRSKHTRSCGCLANAMDLTGMRFGKLVPFKRVENGKWNEPRWLCKCDCGGEIIVLAPRLKSGNTKSCGCLTHETRRGFKDLTGLRIGRLTVIKEVESNVSSTKWLCKCDCGNEKIILYNSLMSGKTKSCGCWNKERLTTHNKSKTRLHKVWHSMKQRCYYINHISYKNYGGRGIKVCDEWLDFQNFYEWAMQNGYDENAPRGKCTIDRIDVNGDYCPENCRFVDMKVQDNNKTCNIYITYNNKTQTLTQWGEELNIKPNTIKTRIEKYNWSIEKSLTTPTRKLTKSQKP